MRICVVGVWREKYYEVFALEAAEGGELVKGRNRPAGRLGLVWPSLLFRGQTFELRALGARLFRDSGEWW